MAGKPFIGKLSTALRVALVAQFLPYLKPGIEADGQTPLHYRPLNGDSLRDIVRRKRHHDGDIFVNPMGISRKRRFWQVLGWKLLHKNAYEEFLGEQPTVPVAIDWEPIKDHQGVSVTYIKHATLLIKDGNRILLIDPVFNAILRFIKDYTPLAFDLDAMPRPDHVLITHGHYDHLDMRSLARLDAGTHVISPLGYDREFGILGMTRRTRLDWFESFRDGDLEVTFLPANHWTTRNPFIGPNRSLWGGYLIRTAGGPVIYVSGDSAYFDGFEQLAAEEAIDLAIFNVGAYAPRWFMAASHMNPAETVQAFQDIKARRMMIAHWGTFRLGDEPAHFPPIDLKRVLKKKSLLQQWVPLSHGETYYF
jgi:N-acyl-phosphatidylethanolamine-hydrolysing phospholipase D